MFKALFGSNTVEKILLYLLVNEECYAHQLHRQLNIPLTPVQKALERLEKGGIIRSHAQKNRKLYQFNPDYPIIPELEQLLKKAYHQLPLTERKVYHQPREVKLQKRIIGNDLLQTVWNQLKTVSRMTWIASSHSHHYEQFSRKGEGIVESSLGSHFITFIEKGTWKTNKGVEVNYSNTYRWTWSWQEEMIALEHLRHGKKHPAFLFYLKPSSNNLLESAQPHLCGDDTYFGWLQQHHLFLQLQIRTLGPYKNECIETIYT